MADPNKKQEKAIKTINENLVVNAGAGTGKTKVLTERYIEILSKGSLNKGNEIESIVAITFTKKATQEMTERIREEIKKRLVLGEEWIGYYRDLEKANISTIHGFCANILRENPVEANIDPYFQILDDIESKKILYESIIKVLNKYLRSSGKFNKILNILDIYNLKDIAGDFANLYRDIRTLGISINTVLDETLAYLETLTIEKEDIVEIKQLLEYLIENMAANSKIAKLKTDEMWLDFYNNKYEEEKIYEYMEYFFENLGNSKREKEYQDRLKSLLQKVLSSKERDFDWYYIEVIDILNDIDKEYEKMKREKGYLDYDDLQIKVLELLDNREILEKYQEKYRYFMIDEFQDTNELQKKIFYRLCTVEEPLDRKNLFVVGDPKQSIYGFRGADVEVFYDVLGDIEKYNKDNVITLDINYRSHNVVMNFVNKVFEKIMGDRYDALEAFKKDEKDLEVEILEKKDIDNKEGLPYSDSELNNKIEAEMIAKRINALVENNEYDYKDMAILFRATSRTHIYEEVLEYYDIPYYNTASKRFFYKQEIKDVINALKAISNPLDQISTVGFLKSPFIGLNDETIFFILEEKSQLIIDKLKDKNIKSNIEDMEYKKILEAIDHLEYFYRIKDFYPIDELLLDLLKRTNYLESLLLKEDGAQLVANVNRFINLTRDYDKENLVSLEEYIDYIEEIRDENMGEETIEMEDSNVVKILTIHGSKGLEFPVVFVPELRKSIYFRANRLGYHKEFGLYIKNEIKNGRYDYISQRLKEIEEEENERIYYVAMTRAEELLVLGFQGKDSGFKKKLKKYLNLSDVKFIEDIGGTEKKEESLTILRNLNKVKKSEKEFSKPKLLYDIDSQNKFTIDVFSATQYMKYSSCKRLYFLEYIWGVNIPQSLKDKRDLEYSYEDRLENLDDNYDLMINKNIRNDNKELSSLLKGEIVHDFCKEYELGQDKLGILDKSIRKYKLEPNQNIYNQLNLYIDNYISYYNNSYRNYEEIHSERPFYHKLDQAYIYGLVDRINISNNGIEIIDFKTNKIKNQNMKNLIDYYKPQLQLYAFVIGRLLDKEVKKSRILFLENMTFVDIDINKEELRANIDNINKFSKFVNKYQDIASYEKTQNCDKFCKFREICNLI